MPRKIVIVGALVNDCDRKELLRRLTELGADIDWDWLKPENEQCQLPKKPFNRLIHESRSGQYNDDFSIIKLHRIHGKDANRIYELVAEPISPPIQTANIEELLDWILNDSGIFNEDITELPIVEITLFAILSKLVKNKSWNKDSQGHNWTQEADLLGQAPVIRQDLPQLAQWAGNVLGWCAGQLLLVKGGNQGRTPLGWCINLNYLPAVKRSLLTRSLEPLREIGDLQDIMNHIDGNADDLLPLDSRIVSEKVLSICREEKR